MSENSPLCKILSKAKIILLSDCLQYFGKRNRINLPTYGKRGKRFIDAVLGNLASSVIGLAFEGISSFLHHKRHKALTKAVNVMKEKVDLQCNRVKHLEDTMIMYSKYN